ncbi:hypothetical protein CYLTODRAFT_442727 [Cylindrobasidium torrendii FP15055 ss-10]|uniref:Uncharacterized protein n=1 Tax=Cylindrobasidium torrendii FP15055 ss-10 TaxID=1314674 RepID=A0A0D7BH24_9AGAR|nr:hypothetical protein CYLTODRAFT_442727 [Cylindrobasidium torrendii FP15055 ss-10]
MDCHQPCHSTTASTLMHSVLAHVSNEVAAFDAIIRSRAPRSSASPPSLFALPTELLLDIREQLVVCTANKLAAQSEAALVRYETSLSRLLCSDCLQYFQEVYGPDVWRWEQFAGTCPCAGRNGRLANPQASTSITSIDPKQFADRTMWLEYYLSRKALRFAQRPPPDPRSADVVWNVVDGVLAEFKCTLVRQTSGDVSVVPKDPHDAAALRCAIRDLGLFVEQNNVFEQPPEAVNQDTDSPSNYLSVGPPPQRPRPPTAMDSIVACAWVLLGLPFALVLIPVSVFARPSYFGLRFA